MKNLMSECINGLMYTICRNPLIMAVVILALGIFIRFLVRQPDSLLKKLRALRKKIYVNWGNNPGINVIRIQKEYTIYLPEQNSAEVYIKVMAHYPSKNSAPNKAIKATNPFLPPFPEGAFIDHLSDTHSLIYNGNSLLRCHCLVITKEFVEQHTFLDHKDFSASVMAMKVVSGFAFFNSAPDAGSSQRHKHLQVVPASAFRYGRVPIDDLITLQAKTQGKLEGKTFTLPQFRFKHLFYMFPKSITANLTHTSVISRGFELEQTYKQMLKTLGNGDIKTAYNLILNHKWMLIVLRKQEMARNTIKINAMAFTGSFVIRNDKEFDLFPSEAPFDILLDVTYPND